MQQTFFFYDLETSGLNARDSRIMQFAGQRTNLKLEPLGEPVNLLVKLNDDTLPSPQAILTTKITPQSTQADGLTEAELCDFLAEEVFTPGTIAVGYNTARFDDEFMRHLFWRNFRDPYTWQWADGRSHWDLLDVVRLTRALRPDGIKWPFTEDGKPTNRLELITKLNGVKHEHAHDALSDVYATIAVARLIRQHQPQLFDYLFNMRDKRAVQQLVNLDYKKPFVYASGRYPSEFNKTTVAFPLAPAPHSKVLVFDLRYNLDELLNTPAEDSSPRTDFYPIVKALAYNKCPAVAPLGVLAKDNGWAKVGLTPEKVQENLNSLLAHPEFAEQMRTHAEERPEWPAPVDPESALYDGFLSDADRAACQMVAAADANRLADLHPNFSDERLPELLLHYKARNYPNSLSEDEQAKWEAYRRARLERQAPAFLEALQEAAEAEADDFILEELSLWLQSVTQ